MPNQPRVPQLRHRKRRGATLVEFALGGSTFCALLIAAFALNYGVFVKATLRHAAQQGARFATTGRALDQMTPEDSVRSIVRQNSFGLLAGDPTAIGITYYGRDGRTEVPARLAAVVEVSVNHRLSGVGAGRYVEVKAVEPLLDGAMGARH